MTKPEDVMKGEGVRDVCPVEAVIRGWTLRDLKEKGWKP